MDSPSLLVVVVGGGARVGQLLVDRVENRIYGYLYCIYSFATVKLAVVLVVNGLTGSGEFVCCVLGLVFVHFELQPIVSHLFVLCHNVLY